MTATLSADQASPAALAPPLLRFEAMGLAYPTPQGPYPVLEGVNLDVQAGEFICVIGHSGCGKSTLLNTVSGFAKPSSGRVLFNGAPIQRPGPDRMVVFQGYALLPWLTAYDNVYLGIDAVKPQLPERQKRDIVMEHLELVGLTAAIAVPSYSELMADRRVQDDALQVASLLREARARAMARGSAVLVSFTNGGTSGGVFNVYESVTSMPGVVSAVNRVPLGTAARRRAGARSPPRTRTSGRSRPRTSRARATQ